MTEEFLDEKVAECIQDIEDNGSPAGRQLEYESSMYCAISGTDNIYCPFQNQDDAKYGSGLLRCRLRYDRNGK